MSKATLRKCQRNNVFKYWEKVYERYSKNLFWSIRIQVKY